MPYSELSIVTSLAENFLKRSKESKNITEDFKEQTRKLITSYVYAFSIVHSVLSLEEFHSRYTDDMQDQELSLGLIDQFYSQVVDILKELEK